MRGNELLCKMELIDPAYLEVTDAIPKCKKINYKKWCALAACFCLIFGLAVPAMAVSIPAFYYVLYEVSPATAQYFKPVQMSCEDNGIRMEVEAVYIHEDTAEIYISMQDLEKTRIDDTIDLFDSYQINTPFDCTGHCELTGYDSYTQAATFLITIEQWNKQSVLGDKLTFSVRKLISNKKTYEGIIDIDNIELNSSTQTVYPRGMSGMDRVDQHANSNTGVAATVLKPVGSSCSPINGVTLTGIGYVDGKLHVQIYYEDILNTDNHGYVSLLNRETGEMVTSNSSISFFDDAGKGSYQDYIFTEIPFSTFDNYELYGCFVTSLGSVEGNWSVTFPLNETVPEAIELHLESQLSGIIAEYLRADNVDVVISGGSVTVEISMERALSETERAAIEHQIQSTLDTEHEINIIEITR